jgi:SAICAR synthetase
VKFSQLEGKTHHQVSKGVVGEMAGLTSICALTAGPRVEEPRKNGTNAYFPLRLTRCSTLSTLCLRSVPKDERVSNDVTATPRLLLVTPLTLTLVLVVIATAMGEQMVLINSNLPDLVLLSRGKVRDIYTTSEPEHLLFVATDRISAYDVVLRNVRPSALYLCCSNKCEIGRPRQGKNPDSDLSLLVLQTPKCHSKSFCHCEHRRDAGRSENAQGMLEW